MKILWLLAIIVIFPLASFGSGGPKFNGSIMHLSNLKEGSYKVGATSSDTRDYSLESEKNPAVAFVLSFLLPGGGQFYNGEHKKGYIMLGGALGGVVLMFVGFAEFVEGFGSTAEETGGGGKAGLGMLGVVGCSLWSMIDAPIAANKINKKIRSAKAGKSFRFRQTNLVLSARPMSSREVLGARIVVNY